MKKKTCIAHCPHTQATSICDCGDTKREDCYMCQFVALEL